MKEVGNLIFMTVLVLTIIILVGVHTYIGGYRDGQIDAINGIVKYELVTNNDKSVEWTKKSE